MTMNDYLDAEKSGLLIACASPRRAGHLSPFSNAAVVTQLLAIRDNHPQWRTNRREDGVIASHAYAATLKTRASQFQDSVET